MKRYNAQNGGYISQALQVNKSFVRRIRRVTLAYDQWLSWNGESQEKGMKTW